MCLLRRQQLTDEEIDLDKVIANLTECSYSIDTDRSLGKLIKLHQIINQSSGITATNNQSTWDEYTTRSQITRLHDMLDDWLYTNLHGSGLHNSNITLTSIIYNTTKLYIYRLAIVSFRLRFMYLVALPQQQSEVLIRDQPFASDHILLMQRLQNELSSNHLGALNICLGSCSLAISHFISLPVPVARDLPLSYYHWMLFTIVCLLKLAPLAEGLQKLTLKPTDTANDDNTVVIAPSEQLEQFTDRLETICKDDHVPQLGIFVTIMRKLQVYYLQRKELCMNSKIEGCDHNVKSRSGKALNLYRDDLDVRDNDESCEATGIMPKLNDASQLNAAQDHSEINFDTHTLPEPDLSFMERIDLFFEQEDDQQWLGFLDWNWS